MTIRYVNHVTLLCCCVTLILLEVTTFSVRKFIHLSNIKKMKIMIFLVALAIPLMAGIMFTGYQSSTQKKDADQAKVRNAKQDLNAAQKDTNAVMQKVATAKEWKNFNKSEFELKFKANEIHITELNVKIQKTAELFDAFYVHKIANLEKENRFLKARLGAYEKSQGN